MPATINILNPNASEQAESKRLARVDRQGASTVFHQGFLPAVELGTQVWGYSSEDLRNIQSFFLTTVAPLGKGKVGHYHSSFGTQSRGDLLSPQLSHMRQ